MTASLVRATGCTIRWAYAASCSPSNIEEVVARLRAHGAELVGEITRYEDKYRLCYMRGPEGIMVALAEQVG